MAEQFKVHGMEALQKSLAELPSKIEKNILRGMVRAGANVVKKSAQQKSQNLMIIAPSRSKSKGKIVVMVGPSKEQWYLKFKELGTKPHLIKSKKKKLLSDGTEVYGRVVEHPGQAAEPFLRPALDENVPEIIEAMRVYGVKRVEKEAAKASNLLLKQVKR